MAAKTLKIVLASADTTNEKLSAWSTVLWMLVPSAAYALTALIALAFDMYPCFCPSHSSSACAASGMKKRRRSSSHSLVVLSLQSSSASDASNAANRALMALERLVSDSLGT